TIGRPIAHTQAYVLDAEMQPVPLGVAGELYLGGAGLARGYLQRPDLTAARFVPDPFSPQPGARLYRTGDRVRYRADGQLAFLGRLDHQVKVRGFRIELDEIAAVLRQHPDVQAAVAIVREDIPGDPRIVAYVVEEPRTENLEPVSASSPSPAAAGEGSRLSDGVRAWNEGLRPADLRRFLATKLPSYMVPSAFVQLESLPLTPNGKLDRKALPAPEARVEPSADRVLPRTPLEEAIAGVWTRVLGRESIGVHDDFFALGGHSLLVVRVMAELRQQFGRALPLATLLQSPTIAQLAAQLEQSASVPAWSPLVPLQSRGERQPFFCVHPIGGTVFCYADLARALGPDQPFYGLQARGLEVDQHPYRSIPELAADYITAIRQVQPHGPYLLGGWSFGGLVAFEIASQLQRQGEEIRRVVLIDSAVPPSDQAPPDEAVLLAQFAHDLGGLLGTPVVIDPADLASLTPDERLSYILEHARRQQALPPDITFEQFRRLADVFASHLSAMQAYQPPLTSLPLALVEAAHPAGIDAHTSLAESWQPFGNVVAQHAVPGTHYSLLHQPRLQAVATWLSEQLVGGV
ncbi:MAG TPA: thioesterase domain-containing protein, partial [Herpetosiphonaceae bacterium]